MKSKSISVILILIMSFAFFNIGENSSKVEAVSSFSATLSPGWTTPTGADDCSIGFNFFVQLSGFGTPDSQNGFDEIAILMSDGDGTQLMGLSFTYMAAGNTTTPLSAFVPSNITHRPVVISFYDTAINNNERTLQGYLGQVSFDPATKYSSCLALPLVNPPIIPPYPVAGNTTVQDREAAAGISRVYDNEVVVAKQSNGDYHFYRYDGCLIGSVTKDLLDFMDLSVQYNILLLENCDYTVQIDSSGLPECRVVLNMYGPGYSETHWLQDEFDGTRSCAVEENTSSNQTGSGNNSSQTVAAEQGNGFVFGSTAEPGETQAFFVNGIQNIFDDHLTSLNNVQRILGDTPVLGVYNATFSKDELGILVDSSQTIGDQFQAAGINRLRNNQAVINLVERIRSHDGPIEIIAHSQGSLITAAAITVLRDEGHSLQDITVYTFGSPGLYFPNMNTPDDGPTYRHCTFILDPITMLTDSRNTVPNFREIPYNPAGYTNLNVLGTEINLPNITFANHDFATYMNYYDECTSEQDIAGWNLN